MLAAPLMSGLSARISISSAIGTAVGVGIAAWPEGWAGRIRRRNQWPSGRRALRSGQPHGLENLVVLWFFDGVSGPSAVGRRSAARASGPGAAEAVASWRRDAYLSLPVIEGRVLPSATSAGWQFASSCARSVQPLFEAAKNSAHGAGADFGGDRWLHDPCANIHASTLAIYSIFTLSSVVFGLLRRSSASHPVGRADLCASTRLCSGMIQGRRAARETISSSRSHSDRAR